MDGTRYARARLDEAIEMDRLMRSAACDYFASLRRAGKDIHISPEAGLMHWVINRDRSVDTSWACEGGDEKFLRVPADYLEQWLADNLLRGIHES